MTCFRSAIKEAKSDYEIKQRRCGSMKDNKERKNENIFVRDNELGQMYEWVNANRNLFRRPFHGPIVCEIVKRDDVTTAGMEAGLKIGMKVPVENRVQWFKLPSGGKAESIKWWPGVLYESYTELIQDVGECFMLFFIYL